MSPLVLSFAVAISCAFADPSLDHLVASPPATAAVAAPLTAAAAAPLAAAPVAAPAVITARSYQVFARNYNALAAPFVAASPIAPSPLLPNAANLDAPLIAGAPIVAAEDRSVSRSGVVSAKLEKSTLEPTRNDQPSSESQNENVVVVSAEDPSIRSDNATSTGASARSGPGVIPVSVVSGATFARQSVVAAPAAVVAGSAPYIAAPVGFPFVASPYFSSAAATSNYVRFY